MKKFLLVLVFLFSLSIASASFGVQIEPEVTRIDNHQIGLYKVTIENFDDVNRVVSITMDIAQGTNWLTNPNTVTVPANSKKEFTLELYPKATTPVGSYSLLMNFRSSGEVVSETISARVIGDSSELGYVPNVAVTTMTPSEFTPDKQLPVSVNMRNRNQRILNNLSVLVHSDYFEQEFSISLEGLQEVSRQLQFTLEDDMPPGNYNYNVRVFYEGTRSVIAEHSSSFTVSSYSRIDPRHTSESSWFKETRLITLVNEGNVARSKEVAIQAPFYKRLFMSTDEDYEVQRLGGVTYMVWNPLIEPNETKNIVVTTSYRGLISLILLLIIAKILYFSLRSPLIIRKEVILLGKEDGANEMKVRLFVKNRSRKTVFNISLSDKLSKITTYVPINKIGSVTPSKVLNNVNKGTMIYWNFDSLEPLEERVLTYNMKSSLKIIGNLAVPSASAKFENEVGREIKTNSGKTLFSK